MNIKEFTVKQNAGFALKVKSWKCVAPADLNSIEFINECYNEKGEVTDSSIYNFFMTDDEIKTLCEGMLK